MSIKLNFFILVLPLYFYDACSIKCYVCNSKEDAKCMDPFNISMTLQDCQQDMSGEAGNTGVKALDVVEIIMQNLDGKGMEQRTDLAVSNNHVLIDTVCQKITVSVGEETITSRGCSPLLVDRMHPCDAVKLSTREPIVQLRHCLICANEGCNSTTGGTAPWSILSVTLYGLLLFRLKLL